MIDWQQVILNLRRFHSCAVIARKLNSDAAHIQRIARGEVSEPRFNTGVKILDLHFDLCPDQHSKIIQQGGLKG